MSDVPLICRVIIKTWNHVSKENQHEDDERTIGHKGKMQTLSSKFTEREPKRMSIFNRPVGVSGEMVHYLLWMPPMVAIFRIY